MKDVNTPPMPKLQVLMEKQEEGFYLASLSRTVDHSFATGDTEEEALASLKRRVQTNRQMLDTALTKLHLGEYELV